MSGNQPTATSTALRTQTNRMREEYPELFAYLEQRDTMLRQTLARLPSETDIELTAACGQWSHLERLRTGLQPGVAELAGR